MLLESRWALPYREFSGCASGLAPASAPHAAEVFIRDCDTGHFILHFEEVWALEVKCPFTSFFSFSTDSDEIRPLGQHP